MGRVSSVLGSALASHGVLSLTFCVRPLIVRSARPGSDQRLGGPCRESWFASRRSRMVRALARRGPSLGDGAPRRAPVIVSLTSPTMRIECPAYACLLIPAEVRELSSR